MDMDTIILIMNLFVGIIGIVLIWLGYQKDKTSKPEAKGILGKRILFLTLTIAVINLIQPIIKHFSSKPPPAATKEDVRKIVAEYMGEKPKNPPVEEAKSEIKKELHAAFEKQENRALELYRKGNEAYNHNKFEAAKADFEAALQIVAIPSIYLALGNCKLVTSDYRGAMAAYEIALANYKVENNRKREADALGNLGLAYFSTDQYHKAINYHTQALAISREAGDREGEGYRLGSLGLSYFSIGEYSKAIEHYGQALAIARETGDLFAEGNRLANLGNVYFSLGQYKNAIDFFTQSLAIGREINDRVGEGHRLGNLGSVYGVLGQYDKAIEHYTQALSISQDIGNRQGEGIALGNLGNVYNSLGRFDQAKQCYEQSIAILVDIQSPYASKVRQWLAEVEAQGK